MTDILLGALAIAVGALLCFSGQVLLRLVIPIWGAFAGFAFGAGLVAGFSDEHFLGTVLGWALGLLFAVVFALLAYLYYVVGVVLAMAAIGFSIGAGLIVAIGIDWNWVSVLIGVLIGGVFGLAAVITDVPGLLLIVLGAVGGALVMVAGFMLVTGVIDSADFSRTTFTSRIDDSWWWYAAFLVLAVLGGVAQARQTRQVRSSMGYTGSSAGR